MPTEFVQSCFDQKKNFVFGGWKKEFVEFNDKFIIRDPISTKRVFEVQILNVPSKQKAPYINITFSVTISFIRAMISPINRQIQDKRSLPSILNKN